MKQIKSKEKILRKPSPASPQFKLEIGKPNDPYEREADQMADRVMKMPADKNVSMSVIDEDQKSMNPSSLPNGVMQMQVDDDSVQLMATPNEIRKTESEDIQTKTDDQLQKDGGKQYASSDLTAKIQDKKGKGSRLSPAINKEMSAKMGSDFSNVNVHKDTQSAALNDQLGAKAFANGNDIFFNKGKYNPATKSGKHLLAHELTHVIQQNGSVQPKKLMRTPEPSPFTRQSQRDAFDRGIAAIHQSVQNNRIPLSNVVGDKRNGFFTEKELVTVLRNVYYTQTNKPYFDANHPNLNTEHVGENPSTPKEFLGVDLPTVDDILKGFHPTRTEGGKPDNMTATLGYSQSAQMDAWAGWHEGNWFENPDQFYNQGTRRYDIPTGRGVYKDPAHWKNSTDATGNGEEFHQLVDFYHFVENSSTQREEREFKLEGFNAFSSSGNYIVGLDAKLSGGQRLGDLSESVIEDKAHVGYTFLLGDTEFIFWIIKGEAFLEGTRKVGDEHRRISVSTNGGMGMWVINK